MAELKVWLEAKVVGPNPEEKAFVSQGRYNEPEDFSRILALAKAGILGRGRNLARIGFRLHSNRQSRVEVRQGANPTYSARLGFHEMEIRKSEAE